MRNPKRYETLLCRDRAMFDPRGVCERTVLRVKRVL